MSAARPWPCRSPRVPADALPATWPGVRSRELRAHYAGQGARAVGSRSRAPHDGDRADRLVRQTRPDHPAAEWVALRHPVECHQSAARHPIRRWSATRCPAPWGLADRLELRRNNDTPGTRSSASSSLGVARRSVLAKPYDRERRVPDRIGQPRGRDDNGRHRRRRVGRQRPTFAGVRIAVSEGQPRPGRHRVRIVEGFVRD